MAQLHNELRRTPLSLALKAAVGDTREGSGIERFGETLGPYINLWERPEWAFLRRERLCSSARTEAAGGAGTFAGIGICNPAANRDLILTVETMTGASAGAADQVRLLLATDASISALFTTSSNWLIRDTRWPGGLAAGMGVVRQGVNAAAPAGSIQLELITQGATTDVIAKVALPCVLHPGFGLIAITDNDAAALRVSWGGRERTAFKGELP